MERVRFSNLVEVIEFEQVSECSHQSPEKRSTVSMLERIREAKEKNLQKILDEPSLSPVNIQDEYCSPIKVEPSFCADIRSMPKTIPVPPLKQRSRSRSNNANRGSLSSRDFSGSFKKGGSFIKGAFSRAARPMYKPQR
jgi:hypothetical protein